MEKEKRKYNLLRLLVDFGAVSPETVRENENLLTKDFSSFLVSLIRNNLASENKIKEFFVKKLNLLPFKKEKVESIPVNDILKIFSFPFLRRKYFVPLNADLENLKIAILNPTDREIIQYLKFTGVKNYKMYIATLSEIEELLSQLAPHVSAKDVLEDIELESEVEEEVIKEEEESNELLVKEAEESPIVKASRAFIVNAVRMGASDIHIEPFEKEVRVRYRIDGILRPIKILPISVKDALIARYKIMSNLDISEKRLPQDGRIRIKIDGKPIDLRVSIIPTVYGEKIVMRIQDVESYRNLKLEDLGFEEDDLKLFREAIYSPWGMVLVTGPTGSGKTTTLYTALMERNTKDVNISTAEDPVEVAIKGINQVQVKENIGLTFAEVLRAFLRQDPDIILVGEIRDRETAEIAVKAALTGHLVFSTLHTNDAPSSITRLVDIGVESFLVSTSVNLIVAQRLIRKLCPKCKKPSRFGKEFWLGEGLTEEDIETGEFYDHNPGGCEYCNHTGYKGRTAVHELLKIDEDIKKAVIKGKTAEEIREIAIQKGMKTLYQDGLIKIKKGITDIAEVERVLMK
ncbi:GspE/PulE family protein [Hydrogenothermus marinus]|uniref:Type IV pilus assembly protein PilB n=1 Tax=Hydrogenothermus marinus TaxID=133270 RepID=A0A3M0BIU2_9AQUI|nr:ATPase, T2SS/T4P/T4SS family [Hydrogenothermus marinus]RMA97101.1 type IV pilus assembly protein PilB [Hydrogenothermus marinus]